MPPRPRTRPVYCLRDRETVPDGLKRIVREQLQSAIVSLRGPSPRIGRRKIHEARKNLKKVRAILRLMEQELGPVYRIETAQLRFTGSPALGCLPATRRRVWKPSDLLRSRVESPKHDPAFRRKFEKVLSDRKQQFEEGPATDRVFHMMAVALRSRRPARQGLAAFKTEGFAAIGSGD